MDSVTDAEAQDLIAESLLGDQPTEATEQYQEQESGAEQGGQGQPDDWQAITDELRGETAKIEQEANQEVEQQAEQPAEVTPQSVQAHVAELEQFVTERALVDPAESALLAESLGVDRANAAPLGNVISKTVVSALNVWEQSGGQFSKPEQISAAGARAFSNEFLRACGVDPRTSPADPQQLASVVLNGTLSLLQAVQTYGLNASLDELNSAEAAEFFANQLFQCFGQTQQVDRKYALNLADSGARYVLSVLRKLDGQRAEQPQQRRSQGSRSNRGQQRSSGRSRFKTNTDIFDAEAEEAYRLQHGRL